MVTEKNVGQNKLIRDAWVVGNEFASILHEIQIHVGAIRKHVVQLATYTLLEPTISQEKTLKELLKDSMKNVVKDVETNTVMTSNVVVNQFLNPEMKLLSLRRYQEILIQHARRSSELVDKLVKLRCRIRE